MKLSASQYGILAAGLVTAILHLAAAFDCSPFSDSPDMLLVVG
jgi:hypothetical protein